MWKIDRHMMMNIINAGNEIMLNKLYWRLPWKLRVLWQLCTTELFLFKRHSMINKRKAKILLENAYLNLLKTVFYRKRYFQLLIWWFFFLIYFQLNDLISLNRKCTLQSKYDSHRYVEKSKHTVVMRMEPQ